MSIQAWAPGHATLFFSVPKSYDNPLDMGSLGAGFNFETGVLTKVEKSENDEVYWNSEKIDGIVTISALNKFREITGIRENVKVKHQSELKIGFGLSTSGAGALGTVIACNKLFNTSLDQEQLYQIAHYADVINHTGLGSVMGQVTRGIEIRTEQGGPGRGKTLSIYQPIEIIILMIDKLRTSEVLVSEEQMKQVNKAGEQLIQHIEVQNPDIAEILIRKGREFAENCGLMTSRVRKVLDDLEEIGEDNASMAMIGETIIVIPNDSEKIIDYTRNHSIDTVVTKLSTYLPSLLEYNHTS